MALHRARGSASCWDGEKPLSARGLANEPARCLLPAGASWWPCSARVCQAVLPMPGSRTPWKGLWENSGLLFSYLFLEIDFESNGRARKEAFVVTWTESGASAGTNRCLQLGRGSSPSSSSESWLVLPSCTLTELLCPCNPSRSAARAARLLGGAFCSLLSCKPCAAGFIESLGLENH